MDSWLMTTPLGNGLGTRPIRAGYSRRKEGSTFSIILSSNVCHEATYSMHRTSDTKCHRTLKRAGETHGEGLSLLISRLTAWVTVIYIPRDFLHSDRVYFDRL